VYYVPPILALLLVLCTSCTQPLPDQDWEFNLGLEVSFTTQPSEPPTDDVLPRKP
jgi:hypothetical protein